MKFTECIDVVGERPIQFDGQRKYVSTGAVDTDHIDENSVEFVDYETRPSRADLTAQSGDVLFAKMAGTNKTLLLDDITSKNIYSTGFFAIRAKESVIKPKCLLLLISSVLFLAQKDKNASGATQKALTNKGLEAIEITLPPIQEQDVLVKKLNAISEIISARQQQLTALDTLIKARFVEMFGGCDEYVEISELCDVSGGYSFKSGDINIDGDIRILQIGNVYIDNVDWKTINYLPEGFDDKYSKFLLKENDIVIALTRPIIQSLGNVKACLVKAGDLPCLLNQRVGRIVVKPFSKVNMRFLYGCLMTEEFTRYVESCCIGCSQPNISTKDIENYQVPKISIETQNDFAAFVSQVDKSKVAVQKALDEAQVLFDSLMQKYFG